MSSLAHDAPNASPPSKPKLPIATGSVVDACLTVVMSLPVACRACVVMAGLVMAGFYVYGKYWPQPVEARPAVIDQAHLDDPGIYSDGRPDPTHPGADSRNPQNVEADHKAAEDAEAYRWHFNHQSEDNPPEIAIGSDTDPKNNIHYRFFEKTDRCVYVKRRADGIDLTQWVRDPKHHEHDVVHAHAKVDTSDTSSPSLVSAFALSVEGPALRAIEGLALDIMPVLAASSLAEAPEKGRGAQGGNCVNPHHGEFKYWWGQPIDKCNSPMYRQFPDGCVHYQIYNRCANAWDARIFWTTCKAAPHSK